MTVCLTGDVHHMSLDTRDQEYMSGTEVEAALEYAEIARSYDVPVTLFVTGKAVREERERVERLAAMDTVELGGHNYYAFGTLAHTIGRGLTGSWHGPRRFQSWEIGRTVSAFADIGVDITAWRDHAYRHDDHTASLLSEHGFTHFSDAVGPDARVTRRAGLTVVPINTPPDHEHIYHAFRTPEFVSDDDFTGPFGSESVPPDEWLEWVRDSIERRREDDQPATVLAHPSCMRLADNFEAFAKLCETVGDDAVPLTAVTA
jgi:peptidoglycan/xylan/chitin deacetylase (PgdA/CDA1 family)